MHILNPAAFWTVILSVLLGSSGQLQPNADIQALSPPVQVKTGLYVQVNHNKNANRNVVLVTMIVTIITTKLGDSYPQPASLSLVCLRRMLQPDHEEGIARALAVGVLHFDIHGLPGTLNMTLTLNPKQTRNLITTQKNAGKSA